MASLFTDFLTVLGVRHTETYSDRRFAQMPFQSMYGLANLLKEYGVGVVGVTVPEALRKDAIRKLPLPFLADTADGFAIVTKLTPDGHVAYMSQHASFVVSVAEMASGWNGVALLAAADSASSEPEYSRHHIAEMARSVKRWMLMALSAILVCYAMFSTGLYAHWSAWLVLAFDCVGITLSWMLVQKSLGVRNKAADAVCSGLEEGGCDELARSEASSFMGIFKWSEVGMAYFSVSVLSMLLFPGTMPALAVINMVCLPYTVWSIAYQKFKAKLWCTLCVCVQATLWLLFISYLSGGWVSGISFSNNTLWIQLVVLACCYMVALLGVNRLVSAIEKYFKPERS